MTPQAVCARHWVECKPRVGGGRRFGCRRTGVVPEKRGWIAGGSPLGQAARPRRVHNCGGIRRVRASRSVASCLRSELTFAGSPPPAFAICRMGAGRSWALRRARVPPEALPHNQVQFVAEPLRSASSDAGRGMIDREKVLTVLRRRFPLARPEDVAAAANAIVGLGDEWDDVTEAEPNLGAHLARACGDHCFVAHAGDADFRLLVRRARG